MGRHQENHWKIMRTVFLLAKCFSYLPDDRIQALLEGKYSLESTDPCESEIRAPPQPLPYVMPIPPTRFFILNSTY